jgi:hypothetical protein
VEEVIMASLEAGAFEILHGKTRAPKRFAFNNSNSVAVYERIVRIKARPNIRSKNIRRSKAQPKLVSQKD